MAKKNMRSYAQKALTLVMAFSLILGMLTVGASAAPSSFLTCTTPEHTHNDGCYTWSQHTHADECYVEHDHTAGTCVYVTHTHLETCPTETHAHEDACYTTHAHEDTCYTTHAHEDACYTSHAHDSDCYGLLDFLQVFPLCGRDEGTFLTCGQEEGTFLTCGQEEGTFLTCTIPDMAYTCGIEQDQACPEYDLICTEPTKPVKGDMICGLDEHVHSSRSCYASQNYAIHLDIHIGLTATYILDGISYTEDVTLEESDYRSGALTIVNSYGETINVTSISRDPSYKNQMRFNGSFPVGADRDTAAIYTITLKKDVTFDEAGVTIPMTFSDTVTYWDAGNCCESLRESRGYRNGDWARGEFVDNTGMDFKLGASTETGTSSPAEATLTIQKNITGLDLTADQEVTFTVYNASDNSVAAELTVTVDAGSGIGLAPKALPIGESYYVVETGDYAVADYTLTTSSAVNGSTGDATSAIFTLSADTGVVFTNAYTENELPPPEPPVTPPAPTYTLTVKYLTRDDAGNVITLADPTVTEGFKSGDIYTTEAKSFDGYTLAVTPTNASGTFADEDITVTYIYNKGEQPPVEPPAPATYTLTINKTIEGAVSGGAHFTFNVLDLSNRSFILKTAWVTIPAGETTGSTTLILPANGSYVLEEGEAEDAISGHYLVGTSSQIAGGEVKDGRKSDWFGMDADTTVSYVNTYEPILGGFSINKTTTGNTTPAAALFTVTNAAGEVVATVPYSDFYVDEYDTSFATVWVGDLPLGTYTVTESGAEISGYSLSVTGNGASVEVTENGEPNVDITNAYTQNSTPYYPPYNPPADPPVDPPIDIPDEPVPLDGGEEIEDLPDEEVPLADVPETGEEMMYRVLALASGVTLAGLVFLGKKKEEEQA